MHPPVSLMSSNVFWRPSSAAGQRCVHRIAHLLSQSAVVPLLTPPHFSASLLWVFSSAAGLFTPFPFLCPCSSVLVGVVRTAAAAAAVTGASVLLLFSPRLSSPFTSILTLCCSMMTKARTVVRSETYLIHWIVSLLCFYQFMFCVCISSYRYVTP